MPLLTPSRLAVAVLAFSLISFFWTFGLPQQLGYQPSRPIIDHYDYKNVHSDPIIPAPSIESKHASAPAPTEPADHRWDDSAKTVQTEAASPAQPGQLEGASHVPTTLITAALPAPTAANGTNASLAAPGSATAHSVEKFCKDVHGAPHVMVVLRTSKAEIGDKLPTHLKGLLSCVPNFAIFSDHAGAIEGHTVYNALESISSETKRTHDEFREYQLMHADADHKPDSRKTKDLDKWKFLPMVYKAYKLNTAAKFFVFVEADTSLSWTNTLQWVDRLDYRIPYYSGAPTFMQSVQLAQRGSGILLSQGALRRYANSYEELYTTRWEERVAKECCGDLLLAMALNDAHVEFYSSWPLLQSEQPSTLDYNEKHWCVPAVSWHHLNGDHLSDMWALERNWTRKHGWSKPYLFRDAFHDAVEPHMAAHKESWDNLSQDTKIVAPQGRQQQIKEEEERSKNHQKEEDQKNDKEKQDQVEIKEDKKSEEEEKKAREKKEDEEKKAKQEKEKLEHEQSVKESQAFQKAESESHDMDDKKMRKRDEEKKGPDWDKLAETFSDAGDSAERCQKACDKVEDCLQWRYTTHGDGECHLGKVTRLGKKTEGDEKWTSGWMVERMKTVSKNWDCKEIRWGFYQ